MKKIFIAALAGTMMLTGNVVFADPKDEEQLNKVLINRCSDAGRGNGPEGVGLVPNNYDDEGNPNDLDPGGSPMPNNGQDVVDKAPTNKAGNTPNRKNVCPESPEVG